MFWKTYTPKMHKKLNMGDKIQTTGLLIMLLAAVGNGCGIAAEVYYAADIYLEVITVFGFILTIGSIIYSVGTKIKGN